MLSIAVGLWTIYPSTPSPRNLDTALAYIFTQRQPGDAVIVLDWQSFDSTALYYPNVADVYVGAPATEIDYWQRRMALMRWITPSQVGPAEWYAERYQRIWVLQTPYTYPKNWDATAPWLKQHAHLSMEHDLPSIRVLLYEMGG
ncbi:hypothetical protein EKD04_009825 [Chloroflexales bacterium ZM16-3]|nr:hypothetical protein [Chloroflexales bacterium ZM16-3]